jgi:hypothetical protein
MGAAWSACEVVAMFQRVGNVVSSAQKMKTFPQQTCLEQKNKNKEGKYRLEQEGGGVMAWNWRTSAPTKLHMRWEDHPATTDPFDNL